MLDVRRHVELFDPYNFKEPITIIGCGATGSWVALYLAKLGITDITIYDFDIVEGHNIANQAFGLKDINDTKAFANQKNIIRDTGTEIVAKSVRYIDQRLRGVVFLMVDSMKERKRIWEKSLKLNPNITLVIEPRMGLNMGRVYTIDPSNINQIKAYEETYYEDDDAEVSACGTSVSVITSATMIASICVRQLINYSNSVHLENEILVDMVYWNFINNTWK